MREWNDEIRKQLTGLNLPPAREEEIIEELLNHLENLYEELLAGGAAPEKAHREVLASLSQSDLLVELRATERTAGPDPIPEGIANSGHLLADLWQDLRYAARMLRNPSGHTCLGTLSRTLHSRAHRRLHHHQHSPLHSAPTIKDISARRAN